MLFVPFFCISTLQSTQFIRLLYSVSRSNGARSNLRTPFQKLGYFLNEIGKGDTVMKFSKQDQCVEGCVRNKAATYIFCTQGASLSMLLLTATVQATEQKNRQQIPAHFFPSFHNRDTLL